VIEYNAPPPTAAPQRASSRRPEDQAKWPARMPPLPLPVLLGRARSARDALPAALQRAPSRGPEDLAAPHWPARMPPLLLPTHGPNGAPVAAVYSSLVFKMPVRDEAEAGGKGGDDAAAAAAAAAAGRGAGFRRFVGGAVARLDPEQAEDAVDALQAALPMPAQVDFLLPPPFPSPVPRPPAPLATE
jgi:hypothetical protein